MEGARTWPVPISAQSQHRWQERRLRTTRGRLLFSSLSRAGSQPRIASSYKHMQPGEPAEAIDETDSWQQTTSAGPPRRALPWLSVQLAAIGISTPHSPGVEIKRFWHTASAYTSPLHRMPHAEEPRPLPHWHHAAAHARCGLGVVPISVEFPDTSKSVI